MQLLQSLSDQNKTTHQDFYPEMLGHCENEDGFIKYIIFNNELFVNPRIKFEVFLYKTVYHHHHQGVV